MGPPSIRVRLLVGSQLTTNSCWKIGDLGWIIERLTNWAHLWCSSPTTRAMVTKHLLRCKIVDYDAPVESLDPGGMKAWMEVVGMQDCTPRTVRELVASNRDDWQRFVSNPNWWIVMGIIIAQHCHVVEPPSSSEQEDEDDVQDATLSLLPSDMKEALAAHRQASYTYTGSTLEVGFNTSVMLNVNEGRVDVRNEAHNGPFTIMV